jgi:SAM-dependent methyltransferase
MSNEIEKKQTDAERFWEERYQTASSGSSGKPGVALCKFTEALKPGRALELGCARGDDAIWLAYQGWTVVAVDISRTALGHAADIAERSGVADRVAFEKHDLSRSFPDGSFDLVVASFLQSPFDWPRAAVLVRAAGAVAPEGHLLIIDHGSRAPWSSALPDRQFPTVEQTLADLALPDRDWARLHAAAIERRGTGPDGQTAMVRDNVIFLRRLSTPEAK